MARSMFVLSCVLSLLQDPKPQRNPWAGFDNGSWVVIETTTTVGEETKTRIERIMVNVDPDGTVTQGVAEEKPGEPPPIFFATRTHMPGAAVEDSGALAAKPRVAELEIAGKKIACDVTEYDLNEPANELQTKTIVWRARDVKVPYRELMRAGPDLALDPDVLQYEMSLTRGADAQGYKARIVDFKRKMTVGTRDVLCVVEEADVEDKKGERVVKVKLKRWLSDEIPGRVLRGEIRGEDAGKKIVRIEQVKDFRGK